VLCAFDLLELDGENLRRTPRQAFRFTHRIAATGPRYLEQLISNVRRGIFFPSL
jgi:hypothetical protein